MIGGFPKGVVVFVVLILGAIAVVVFNPPHRLCTSQIEKLRELQKGKVFSSRGKTMERSPRIYKYIENCKSGNSPGACFELFSTMRGLVRDLYGIPLDCAEDLSSVAEVKGALRETLSLMTQIAWGEEPPKAGVGGVEQGWFEAGDLALFCNLRDMYTRFFGKEEIDQLKMSIFSKLSGEKAVFTNNECVNCDFRKTALQVMGPEEIQVRSLFGVRCELFR